MEELWKSLLERVDDPDFFIRLGNAILILVIGFLVTRIIIFILLRGIKRNLTPQSRMLLRKTISYTGLAIVVFLVLNSLGINMAPLLGAAGILGIALGFASQTSISNIISGIFLIAEKPFEIGDIIKVNGNVGVVKSVDLLSVKIHGFDNRYIRIPNEVIIKTEVINITRFPIRRLDLQLRVAYKEDICQVRELLHRTVNAIPECLDHPEPTFQMQAFSDRGVEFLFGVWIDKKDYISMKNQIMLDIKEAFDRQGIEIPYPHMRISQSPPGEEWATKAVLDDSGKG